ncbi:MAG TPA: helix-turn-helix domain-containing protein [Acinetobacter pittii]|jgi:SOS-response transcriptional repressor LexA|nr:S24 family peptidase [Acinetobacter baumannii]HIN57429.1 helix-turn-helix domain-containing protein [Acinetobacter pittii]
METIGKRIKSLRKAKKLTQKDLGKLLGLSDVSVLKWENETNTPKLENMHELALALDTTVEYLMYGKTSEESSVVDFRPVSRLLPVLTHVQAGNWTSVQSISKYDINQWLPAPPSAGKNSFYMIVKGTSNAPHFNDGDYICIDPDIPIDCVQTGEMVVVQHEGDATFKALVKEDNRMYLQALNENYHPNIIFLKEDSVYKGKYVGKFETGRKFL